MDAPSNAKAGVEGANRSLRLEPRIPPAPRRYVKVSRYLIVPKKFPILERCESGRIGLPAKELCPERVPGVRIPPAPYGIKLPKNEFSNVKRF